MIAPVLVLIFAVHWHIFPGPASYVPLTQDFWSNIHTMLLPSIVLALGSIVVYFRLLRNDLISTLQEDFITMARSKGLSDRRIMWRHALRPSSISLLASAGVTIGSLIAGTFVVELLLQMPGLGLSAHLERQPGRLHGRAGHHPVRGRRHRADQLHLRLPLHHRRPEDRP